MIIKDWKKEIFTVPNVLSMFRLILVPLYVMIYLNARSNADFYIAAAILAVSCLTDLIDGQIARRFNMISTVGKILDPLADKITQFTMVFCLSIRHPVLWVIVGLLLVKEIYQLIAGILRFRKGAMLKGAQITGKICTTVLFVSLILLVMLPDISETVVQLIALIDAAFLMIAFVDYAIVYNRKDSKFQPVEKKAD